MYLLLKWHLIAGITLNVCFRLDSLLSEFILGNSSSEELLFPSDTSYTIFIDTGKTLRLSLGKIILLGYHSNIHSFAICRTELRNLGVC